METASPEQQFFSTTHVAKVFGVNVDTVRRWISTGRLEGCVQIGHLWRVPRSAIEKIANERHGATS